MPSDLIKFRGAVYRLTDAAKWVCGGTSEALTLRYHRNGVFRTQSIEGAFGQIKKVNRKWHGEIRNSSSGEVIRYAGIWDTREEAIDEIKHIFQERTGRPF